MIASGLPHHILVRTDGLVTVVCDAVIIACKLDHFGSVFVDWLLPAKHGYTAGTAVHVEQRLDLSDPIAGGVYRALINATGVWLRPVEAVPGVTVLAAETTELINGIFAAGASGALYRYYSLRPVPRYWSVPSGKPVLAMGVWHDILSVADVDTLYTVTRGTPPSSTACKHGIVAAQGTGFGGTSLADDRFAFVDGVYNQVVVLDTDCHVVAKYALPASCSRPYRIHARRSDGLVTVVCDTVVVAGKLDQFGSVFVEWPLPAEHGDITAVVNCRKSGIWMTDKKLGLHFASASNRTVDTIPFEGHFFFGALCVDAIPRW
eukprot:m51a1_g4430 hypothetical protein (319) ;mRNA; f:69725-73216